MNAQKLRFISIVLSFLLHSLRRLQSKISSFVKTGRKCEVETLRRDEVIDLAIQVIIGKEVNIYYDSKSNSVLEHDGKSQAQ